MTALRRSGEAPLNVTFTDASKNGTAWAWQFGDGATSSDQNTSHTYTAPGTYQVNLTVQGVCNNDTESKSVTVWLCPPPVANFTFATNVCDLNVTFTDTSANNPTSWAWEFGHLGKQSHQLGLGVRRWNHIGRPEPGPHLLHRWYLCRQPDGRKDLR